MPDPILLYVETNRMAQTLQRDHDRDVVTVLPILSMGAYRASAIIVHMPRPTIVSGIRQAEFDDWLEWLPTRLAPGEGKRITLL